MKRERKILGKILLGALSLALTGACTTDTFVDSKIPPTLKAATMVNGAGEIALAGGVYDWSTMTADQFPADTVAINELGTLVLGFNQFLKGDSVVKIVQKLVPGTNTPLFVGKGDWEGKIPVIDHYEDIPGLFVIKAFDENGVEFAPPAFTTSYNPGGFLERHFDDAITKVYPPAVLLSFDTETPIANNSVIVVHLVAENAVGIKGISGLPLAPAVDANGNEVVIDGKKIGASVAFRFQN